MCFFPKAPNPGTPPAPQLPVAPPRPVNQTAVDARQQQIMQLMKLRGIGSTNRQNPGGPAAQSPGARTILGPAPGTTSGGY